MDKGFRSEWRKLIHGDDTDWKSEIKSLFDIMVDRTPNTSIEENHMPWYGTIGMPIMI